MSYIPCPIANRPYEKPSEIKYQKPLFGDSHKEYDRAIYERIRKASFQNNSNLQNEKK